MLKMEPSQITLKIVLMETLYWNISSPFPLVVPTLSN